MPEALFSNGGLTLTPDGLAYDVKNGFFRQIRTGVSRRHGFTPIQHISSVELKTWHSFSILLLLFGMALAFVVANFLGFYYMGSFTFVAIVGGVGLLLFILWFVLRSTRLVVYSDGNLFVAAALGNDDAETFISQYRKLKWALLQRRPSP